MRRPWLCFLRVLPTRRRLSIRFLKSRPQADQSRRLFPRLPRRTQMHKPHKARTSGWRSCDKDQMNSEMPSPSAARLVLVEALRKLILCAKLRLTAKGGDPVVVLEMEPGFGKTHSMLALYHIFSGIPLSRLPGMEGVVGGTGVPNPLKVRRAVLVGDRISPATLHYKPDGTTIRTLWGELAWQLGGHDGYEMVRGADERAISPGGSLVFLLQRYSPCLILADEWPAYALQLHQDSSLPAGTFSEQLAFAKAVAHAARCTASNLLVEIGRASCR